MKCSKRKENLGSSDLHIQSFAKYLHSTVIVPIVSKPEKKKKIGRHCKNEKENP